MAKVETFRDDKLNVVASLLDDPTKSLGSLVRVQFEDQTVVVRRKESLIPLDEEARILLKK